LVAEIKRIALFKRIEIEGLLGTQAKCLCSQGLCSSLEGATITFTSQDSDGVMATGLTGSDGSHRLTSFGTQKSGSGVKAGSCRTSIVKREEPPASDDAASGETSGLTVTVENKGSNTFDFHLVD